jgi:DNA polymerase-3 subunit alpha
MDLFGAASVVVPVVPAPVTDTHDVPKKTLLSWEKDLLGVYLSEHPLSDVYLELRRTGKQIATIAEIDPDAAGTSVSFVGCVAGIRKMTTKANRTMAVVTVEDLGGSIEVVLFPERYDRFGSLVVEDAILHVQGKVDQRNDELQLLLDELSVYESPPENATEAAFREVTLRFVASADHAADLDRMRDVARLLREFEGDDRIVVELVLAGRQRMLASSLRVDWCDDLTTAVKEILGDSAIRVSEPIQPGRMRDHASVFAD